ncbi:MAG TPA: glycosyltransferase family 39 protein [Solirubrobacteraceae bacterium]|jgi:4-amino-4-deoxy-L-arabinose transferase-like glycosyltransferase|nr:glycosyltransferase family 39 protein [Solirubrobacteraceae bacterium]
MAIKLRQPEAAPAPPPAPVRAPRVSTYQWAALALITLGAAVLRLLYIGKVSPDPFYDAAVRSMGLSWHNFFFGAFEPGGSVSIDKPPIDLWLQVASVKVFGFSSTTLKLPEVLAGIAAVPLLFAVVRKIWGAAAGLAAALALAVLPVDVITSRSDTMDAVMMALIVLALLFLVHAVESGRDRWLLAAAATLGVAFDVKLLESLVALPGLALFAYLALPGPRRRRLARLAAAGAVYVAVALSWLTATLLAPAHDRPFAIGSSNGSAWNAAFVFNGTERLGGKSPEPQFTVYQPGHHYPTATQSERDHIPIVPPSPTRLLARIGPLSGERLGLELLVALLLGVPALIWGLRREVPEGPDPPGADEALVADRLRLRRAGAVCLGVWTLTGIALFSEMSRLHPRYVEAFTPAVAAMFGVGLAWAVIPRGRARLAILLGTLAITIVYAERLLYGTPGAWWIALFAALGAATFALLARLPSLEPDLRSVLAPTGTLVLALIAFLAVPLSADVTAIDNHVTDAGYVGALPTEEQRLLSAYLRAHQGTAKYEVASVSATGIGSLIVQDARPVLVLTSYGSRVFTSVPRLQRLIAEGKVRYAFLNASCGRHGSALNPGCSAPAKWVRANGTDVSSQAGLKSKLLWLLPGARP